ncbi:MULTISPECIES: homoserine O-succinyltransferase [unclassified Bradyrhizobium]|uniref:homoserine O-succinyltransferase n=1 Tax=unclassified Bradyrhizobium TaxID=2631580 RepID=UPI0028F005C7|nr:MULTISPECIES: homoserine O-succinyltransferase [unclassified Bradyrhizobium]
MPVKIPDDLPARQILERENISVIPETQAFHQDIRPLQIGIVNVMPRKSVTETQLLRVLGNSPLQIAVTFLYPETHVSKNTSPDYLRRFYRSFAAARDMRFDGLIVTGAPIETMEFEKVSYWSEFCQIMDWSKRNVYSTLHLCWGAQAGLFYHYSIPKYSLERKLFGIFVHRVLVRGAPLLQGFDDIFMAPHSRHSTNRADDIAKVPELSLLAASDAAGMFLVSAKNDRQIFMSGHPEYDAMSLSEEFERDKQLGLSIDLPQNYFIDDIPENGPQVTWRGHANLLYTNWLNAIYKNVPFDLADLKPII